MKKLGQSSNGTTQVVLESNPRKKLSITVLCGGLSAERDISIESGKEVTIAARALGHNVIQIDVDKDVASKINKASPDVAFIALHGPLGEDGTIQGMLEMLDVKYTGSGVLASALGMDKCASKKIFKSENLLTPKYKELCDFNQKDEIDMGWPVVVKPNTQGSSVGISIVHDKECMEKAIGEAFKLSSKVIVEEYIKGRELQCGIIGNDNLFALEPIEIIPEKEFFDFEAKYDPSLAKEIVPAEITDEQKRKIQELSIKAYKAIGCRGFARVDTFLTEDNKIYISEINTIPGLTSKSLFPKEAKASGIEFNDLIQRIINLALE